MSIFHNGVRGDGHLASATQAAKHGTLSTDSLVCSRVIEASHGVARTRIVRADFNAQRSLANRRAHLVKAKVAWARKASISV